MSDTIKKLVVIDGNAIMHRAYHALPPLTAPDGTIVNAVYGFLTMMFRIVDDIKPTHLAVCFDVGKPTFRQKAHPEYWANRPKADDEFISQMDVIHEVLTAMQIPIFEKEGFEGDDMVGTLAYKASGLKCKAPAFAKALAGKQNSKDERDPSTALGMTGKNRKNASSAQRDSNDDNFEVVIVTGDRDQLQLVGDGVSVYMPTKGLSEARLYTKDEDVIERLGVKPSQVVDFKALSGDSSDNYSGVVGIGPKTAITLLDKYGTIEEIYKHIDELPVSQALKLKDGEKMAELSKHLAEIVTNVPIEIDLQKTKLRGFENDEVIKEFEKWGFRSLIRKIYEGEKDKMGEVGEKRKEEKVDNKKDEEQMGLF